MQLYKHKAIVVISILAVSVLACLFIFFPGRDLGFRSEKVTYLNNWDYTDRFGMVKHTFLPHKFDLEKNEHFYIEKRLGDDFESYTTVGFRSSLQSAWVTLDGKEIYSLTFPNKYPLHLPVASTWNVFRLPADSQGKILKIEISSPYSAFSGCVNPVFCGTKSAVLFEIMRNHLFGLVISLILFIIGMMFIISPLIMRNKEYSMLYIGFFAVLISFWLLAESRMLQFITGNQFLTGGLAYVSLSLFPIPMLLYVIHAVTNRFQRVYYLFATIFLLNLITDVVLQITGKADFFDTVVVTHLLIFISIVSASVLCSLEIVKDKNKEAEKFLLSTSILFAFALLELVVFYTGHFDETSLYIRVGLLIYICMIGVTAFGRLHAMIMRNKEALFFERIALIDFLTEGKNRYAFENAAAEYQDRERTVQNLQLVMFDLNDLKKINDTHGHRAGDKVIKDSFNCINGAFGSLGECYRIGGDEFACFIEDNAEDVYCSALQKMNSLIEDRNRSEEIKISIAAGHAMCEDMANFDYKKLFDEADMDMYRNKKMMKPIPEE